MMINWLNHLRWFSHLNFSAAFAACWWLNFLLLECNFSLIRILFPLYSILLSIVPSEYYCSTAECFTLLCLSFFFPVREEIATVHLERRGWFNRRTDGWG